MWGRDLLVIWCTTKLLSGIYWYIVRKIINKFRSWTTDTGSRTSRLQECLIIIAPDRLRYWVTDPNIRTTFQGDNRSLPGNPGKGSISGCSSLCGPEIRRSGGDPEIWRRSGCKFHVNVSARKKEPKLQSTSPLPSIESNPQIPARFCSVLFGAARFPPAGGERLYLGGIPGAAPPQPPLPRGGGGDYKCRRPLVPLTGSCVSSEGSGSSSRDQDEQNSLLPARPRTLLRHR